MITRTLNRAWPHAHPVPASPAPALRRWLGHAFDAARRRWHAFDTRRQLESLDDATLRDIGIRRCEIASVAAEVRGSAQSTRRHARSTAAERSVP